MDVQIFGKNGQILHLIPLPHPAPIGPTTAGRNSIKIGKLIENIPSSQVPFAEDIDIRKTLEHFNRQFKIHAQSILLVDDDSDFLNLAKLQLHDLGHYCEIYLSAETAYKAMKNDRRRFDRLILDQNMPEILGEHFARSMLHLNPDIKICILTADSSSVDHSFSAQYPIIKKPCAMINVVGTSFHRET